MTKRVPKWSRDSGLTPHGMPAGQSVRDFARQFRTALAPTSDTAAMDLLSRSRLNLLQTEEAPPSNPEVQCRTADGEDRQSDVNFSAAPLLHGTGTRDSLE